jgi:hypothetical protein
MAELPGPYDIMELKDGEVREFTILKLVEGEMVIRPKYRPGPEEKRIRVWRVFVPRSDKAVGTDYWDITSQTLGYTLKGVVAGGLPRRVRVKAVGFAPAKRFQVEVV